MKLTNFIEKLQNNNYQYTCTKNKYNNQLDIVIIWTKSGKLKEYTFLDKILVNIA